MRQALPKLNRHGIAAWLVRCDLEVQACPESVPSNGISATIFKAAGREDYHGDLVLDELVAWACASVKSSLVSLRPADVDEAISSPQSWFIVYFTPTASSWRVFTRTFRQTTELVTKFGFNVRFGAIDCERFLNACAARDQVNVHVAAVYYNGSDPTPHLLEANYHDVTVDGIIEHVRDVILPPLITVTPATWETAVIGKLNEFANIDACNIALRRHSQLGAFSFLPHNTSTQAFVSVCVACMLFIVTFSTDVVSHSFQVRKRL